MTSFRAKLRITSVTAHEYGSETVKFSAQYSQDNPEDNSFSKATPSGSVELEISNPNLMGGVLKPGQIFYVDFTPAEK